jgi:cysteine desulfurase family protein
MIYFDNAATSFPKAPQVGVSMADAIENLAGNVGRSSFNTALKASELIFDCRDRIADMFKVEDSENIIFTSGATEGLNLLIHGLAKSGGRVLTTPMEHNSVLRPLFELEKRIGLKIDFVECDDIGLPKVDDFAQKIKKNPDFVVVSAASNVTGLVFPFYEMAKIAKLNNVPCVLDAAQAAGSIEINCSADGISAVCFAGHKSLLGPAGVGFCYISEEINPKTLKQGGTGSRSDQPIQPEFKPDKYECGTQNIPGIIGLNAALQFIEQHGIEHITEIKNKHTKYFLDKLAGIDNIIIHTDENKLGTGIVPITSKKYNVSELTEIFDKHGIAVRMGLHCAPLAHKTIGTFNGGGTVRISLSYFNTEKEIDFVARLIQSLHEEEL